MPNTENKNTKNKNNIMVILVILVVIIVLLNIIVVFQFSKKDEVKTGQSSQSVQNNTSEVPDPELVTKPETVYVTPPPQPVSEIRPTPIEQGYLPGKYPEMSTREITMYDIKGMHVWDVIVMRNEVYARYGYIFKMSQELKDYFNSQSWYIPKYNNVDNNLTKLERKNVNFLLKHTPKYKKDNIRGSNTYVQDDTRD
jgi:hypothetical protein